MSVRVTIAVPAGKTARIVLPNGDVEEVGSDTVREFTADDAGALTVEQMESGGGGHGDPDKPK